MAYRCGQVYLSGRNDTTMDLTILAPIGAVAALVYALYLAKKVTSEDEGTDAMKKISKSIREGANAYLKRQYKTVAVVFVVLIIVFAVIAVDLLLIPVRKVYEDGGTQTYTSLTYKVIVWKQIDGKSGTELYIFPNNFHQLDYYGKQGIGIA